MAISVFDLFKERYRAVELAHRRPDGRGPTASPARSSRATRPGGTMRIKVELFGSLGATGKGHGSDKGGAARARGRAPADRRRRYRRCPAREDPRHALADAAPTAACSPSTSRGTSSCTAVAPCRSTPNADDVPRVRRGRGRGFLPELLFRRRRRLRARRRGTPATSPPPRRAADGGERAGRGRDRGRAHGADGRIEHPDAAETQGGEPRAPSRADASAPMRRRPRRSSRPTTHR